MSHVVSQPHPPFFTRDGLLQIWQLPAATDNLIWVLVPSDGSGIAVIDGPEASGTLTLCDTLKQPLAAVLNTHTHGDHIGINRDLLKRGLLDGLRVIGPRQVAAAIPGLTEPVGEGDEIVLGSCRASVLVTEGHLNGHISYLFPGALFCGDTLFAGGCGFLFDGPPKKMFDSLTRLSSLPGDTLVCCAHEYTQDNLRFAWSVEPGNQALRRRIRQVWKDRAEGRCVVPSTIQEERDTNPFLRTDSPELIARVAQAMPDATLDSPLAIFTATRALKDRKDHRAIPDAQLPLNE
ncbi:MAG TPA: hydroxyacylglutathione hydrolase [Polyangiaceae bacterium]|nr:hydroxyacylglutathione hydrolase [Polyangiaceae bacterium]